MATGWATWGGVEEERAQQDEPPHLLLSASGAAGNCCQRWHHRHRSKSRPVCWLPVCVRLLPAALPGRLPCAAATRLRPTLLQAL